MRLGLLDALMVVLSIIEVYSSSVNGEIYTGFGQAINQCLERLAPYFLARLAMSKAEHRTTALKTLTVCATIAGAISVAEFRLMPYLYRNVLQRMGFSVAVDAMAYYRFGFFRAAGTVEHPISWGNAGLILFGLIIVLAKSTGASMRNRKMWLAACLAFSTVITSISFTPIIGTTAGLIFFVAMYYVPRGQWLLFPGLIAATIAIFAFTYSVAQEPPRKTETSSELEGSYETRKLIISVAWIEATHSPLWGKGVGFMYEDYKLDSVDNAYLLNIIWYGPLYGILWMCISYALGFRAVAALNAVRSRSGQFTLAAAVSTCIAIAVAQFTVWAGGIYCIFWMVMLGTTYTLCEIAIDRKVAVGHTQSWNRAFPVMGRV